MTYTKLYSFASWWNIQWTCHKLITWQLQVWSIYLFKLSLESLPLDGLFGVSFKCLMEEIIVTSTQRHKKWTPLCTFGYALRCHLFSAVLVAPFATAFVPIKGLEVFDMAVNLIMNWENWDEVENTLFGASKKILKFIKI